MLVPNYSRGKLPQKFPSFDVQLSIYMSLKNKYYVFIFEKKVKGLLKPNLEKVRKKNPRTVRMK